MRKIFKQLNKNAILLPIKKRVIFVDWFGVLSDDVFWSKYLNKPSCRLYPKVSAMKDAIFSDDQLIKDWMKGKYRYEDILSNSNAQMSDQEKRIINNTLLSYCNKISLNVLLYQFLLKVSDRCFIVLATDNMDCFYESLRRLPQIDLFDAILSSNIIGVLKSEDPDTFFGNWLVNHNMTFDDAMLIDDNVLNCEIFKTKGGNSILYNIENIDKIFTAIQKWVTNDHSVLPLVVS